MDSTLWSQIPDSELKRLYRARFPHSGGRPKLERPCPHCKAPFGARALQAHIPRCPARPPVRIGRPPSKLKQIAEIESLIAVIDKSIVGKLSADDVCLCGHRLDTHSDWFAPSDPDGCTKCPCDRFVLPMS